MLSKLIYEAHNATTATLAFYNKVTTIQAVTLAIFKTKQENFGQALQPVYPKLVNILRSSTPFLREIFAVKRISIIEHRRYTVTVDGAVCIVANKGRMESKFHALGVSIELSLCKVLIPVTLRP